MDGVLVNIPREEALKVYQEIMSKHFPNINSLEVHKTIYYDWKKGRNKHQRKDYLELWYLCAKKSAKLSNVLVSDYELKEIAEEIQNRVEIEASKLYEDVTPVIELLAARYKLGIVSERSSKSIEGTLKRYNLNNIFNFYISSWEIDPDKGKRNPRVWEEAVRLSGQPRGKICYVGDSFEMDVQPALENGLCAVLLNRKRIMLEGCWYKYICCGNLRELAVLMLSSLYFKE